MSLLVETVDYAALPVDILRDVENTDGGYRLPCHVSQSLDHYRYIPCDVCGQPITGHVWFAADVQDTVTRVLRCSESE